MTVNFPSFFPSPSSSADERGIIRQYLAHPRVVRQIIREEGDRIENSYASAIKVFVEMKQDKAESSPSAAAGGALTAHLSYTVLQERMAMFMSAFDVFKTAAYRVRVAKRYKTFPFLPSKHVHFI